MQNFYNLFKKFSFFFLLMPIFLLGLIKSYEVEYSGIYNKKIINQIKNSTDLEILKTKPIRSINALRYRVNSDIPQMIKVLHSYGYYDAYITPNIEKENNIIVVYINVTLRQRYLLKNYKIFQDPCDEKVKLNISKDFTLDQIGIKLNEPIIAQDILDSEKSLIYNLQNDGYPLSKITKQDIVANFRTKDIYVDLCVEKGPICHFGPTIIKGLKHINHRYIDKKIMWKEGLIYTPKLIDETQKRLLKTDLFSSVVINHAKELDDEGQLPITISTVESKHKTISLGVSYETLFGPGIDFSWANRNVRQMGQILSLDANVTKKNHEIVAAYKIPEFIAQDNEYLLRFMATKDSLHLYHSFVYSLMSRLDTKLDKYSAFSFGGKIEHINVKHSDVQREKFLMLSVPLWVKYSNANSLTNPTKGYTISYKASPYMNIFHTDEVFLKQRLIQELYYPTSESARIVLAFRILIGTISGSKLSDIPMTKVFLGGSDDNLRGYRFRTVGPRNSNGDIVGGRSAIYWSIEPRLRITKSIGLVPFMDFGNVTKKEYPQVKGKWHKSIGIGARYYTFFGPVRLDLGFPLDRSKGDPRFRFYISVGQSF
jgi:translocation and assembly module TamA